MNTDTPDQPPDPGRKDAAEEPSSTADASAKVTPPEMTIPVRRTRPGQSPETIGMFPGEPPATAPPIEMHTPVVPVVSRRKKNGPPPAIGEPSGTTGGSTMYVPTANVTSPVGQPVGPLTPTGPLPAGARPRLRVTRGLKVNAEYPLCDGPNYIGRRDEKSVDIDLEDQEPPDRVWSSRQHAVLTLENGVLAIEDLNSLNGTFVNRSRVYPGQKRVLAVNDIIQIGTIQMKVSV